jgi:acyl carrier protein
MGGVELHNLYGPTEAGVDVTWWACEGESERGVVPIGKAIANTEIYILDEGLRAVPVGVAGELYIGGVQLARGYVGRPEMTAERFVPHPFAEGGARLYRTGDLAKWNERAEVEYLGRLDSQVKVRGFRIELGEVEAVLRRGAGVREAAVVLSGEGTDKRLVAFLVFEQAEGEARERTPEERTREVREWMREQVPVYMVPQTMIIVAELPLTANGKVNRRELTVRAGVEQQERGGEREVREARTETEAGVVELWREVLGVERVSVEDNFFEVGGHSLLATRLMSQVRRRFGVEVELRRFFERPSVEDLAQMVELAQQARAKSTPPVISRASREHYRMSTSRQGEPTLPEALRKEAAHK